MSRETWPTVLAQLAELVGDDEALALGEAEGGIDDLYIPEEGGTDHPWARTLSPEAWQRVVAAWGGQRISLPRGTFVRLKKVEIIDLKDEGLSNREIARRVGCGERYVRRILGSMAAPADPRQTRLFD